ncbi:enoyl-CoA hydratase [Sphingobium lactosutens]|uniref:MaoC family dehydratase n=1 Tax=Sphingobium lactosutens TaxID=522773 RepID=UPI0015C04858|nr:MaoC family dehydratase [Sphingobium lactosutens]NWK98603.1 enoyl-CoA hydratase [Sphingobium lactosutens]
MQIDSIAFNALEDHVGRAFGPSAWREISQGRIDLFADATDDHQWIHVDTVRAGQELGGTIAHGLLTLSLLPTMMDDLLHIDGVAHILNYGLNRVRFTQPVRAGLRVRSRLRILSVEPRGAGRMVTCEMTVEIEGETRPACVAETVMLYLPAVRSERRSKLPPGSSLG